MRPNILDAILTDKRAETQQRMKAVPMLEIRRRAAEKSPAKPFSTTLKNAVANGRLPVVAEVKRKSPSKGVLSEDFDVARLVRSYAAGGAACLSVLTDEKYFGGSAEDVAVAAAHCDLPILRKDFVLNEWQIYESRAMGADAILLIFAALATDEIKAMAACANRLGLSVLVEVHDRQEMQVALTVPEVMIGINNRNLKTFHTDWRLTLDLLPIARTGGHAGLILSESGIATADEIKTLLDAGVDAFLIGETLIKEPETGLSRLFGDRHSKRKNQA